MREDSLERVDPGAARYSLRVGRPDQLFSGPGPGRGALCTDGRARPLYAHPPITRTCPPHNPPTPAAMRPGKIFGVRTASGPDIRPVDRLRRGDARSGGSLTGQKTGQLVTRSGRGEVPDQPVDRDGRRRGPAGGVIR